MPFLFHSKARDEREAKRHAIDGLLDNASHTRDYYVLLIGAILLAIGGIFADSIPVLIASMIVAPLAYPVLTLGLGITVGDWRLVSRVVGLLFASCAIALTLAVLMTLLFSGERAKDVYVTFTGNLLLATAVAIVAGAIAAYGTIRSKVASAITGVAIAVSLMPPLVATGIGFASGDTALMASAATLFLLNVVGILAASIIVFKLFRLDSSYETAKY